LLHLILISASINVSDSWLINMHRHGFCALRKKVFYSFIAQLFLNALSSLMIVYIKPALSSKNYTWSN
jgi:hypothetical protein